MEQDPLFVHLTAPTIVYATARSGTTWRFVVVALVLLIFCTLNLTWSRRSDISREYGAKRRGAKKTKHNKTNKKRKKERKEKKREKKLPYLHPRCFFPYSLFFALTPLSGCLEQATQNYHSM